LELDTQDFSKYIYLAIPPKPSSSKLGHLLFVNSSKDKIEYLQSIACHENTEKYRYQCGGECDAGEVNFDRAMGLTLDSKNPLVVEKELLGRDSEKLNALESINIIQKSKVAKAVKTACPPVVNTLYHPKRDKETQKSHYVCYKEKVYENHRAKYSGCKVTKELCRYNRLFYFGHYPSDKETQKALKRCRTSKPKI
jgi:hypothetical protein